jgi:CRISPR/Cas system-associated exonuclease Cas4 (RecB family)
MTLSHTQLTQFLACPKRYRFRYVEGWQEKDTRASMLFGRAFEEALRALFLDRDAEMELARQWSVWKDSPLCYSKNDTWDKMLHQGIHLLQHFAQESRIRISNPISNLQVQYKKKLNKGDKFVAYIDALGHLNGRHSVIEWKTTSSRYPDENPQLLTLDPQLICYSWVTGIADVVLVAFVRKRLPEIQYLPVRISAAQRREYEQLVIAVTEDIRNQKFAPHSGIRFPNNQCLNCAHLGLCLNRPDLIGSRLQKAKGVDVDWINELPI